MQRKVLLVDDARPLLELLSVVLQKLDFEVLTAENGERALVLVEKERPDVVLLDIFMPGLDGFQVCRRIKENKNFQVKVVLCTGEVDAVNNAEARKSGADGFAIKTGDYEDILQKIQETLKN